MIPSQLSLEVCGDFAVFSQPTLKVERFTYAVITPSAARGIFEAIYWKPQFRWQITEIEVLAPIRYIALRRNEVKDRVPSTDTIFQWMTGKAEPRPLLADGDEETTGSKEKGRTQRQTIALKQVRYRLHAEIRPWPEHHTELRAMEAQFRRRAAAGQCAHQPYFGCREFPAYFQLCDNQKNPPPIDLNQQLGWMLYDVFDLSRPGQSTDPPFITIFEATLQQGILKVPPFDNPAVRKPQGEAIYA
jgi:CRISPR-associated protein Cas5d